MKAPPTVPHRRSGTVQPPLEDLEDLDISSRPDSPEDIILSGDSHGPVLNGPTDANGSDLLTGIKLLSASRQMNGNHNGLQQDNGHQNETTMNGTHNQETEHVNHNNSESAQMNESNSHQAKISGSNSEIPQMNRPASQPIQIDGNSSQPIQINRNSSQPIPMNGTRQDHGKHTNRNQSTEQNLDRSVIDPQVRNETRLAFPFNAPSTDGPYRKVSSDSPFVFPEPRRVQYDSTRSSRRENTGTTPSHPIVHSTSPSGPQIRAFRPGFERVWSVLAEGEEDEELVEDQTVSGSVPGASTEDEEIEKMSRTLGDKSPFVRQHLLHVENRFFEMFGDKEKQTININKFLTGLTATGMRPSDPRLKETRQNLKKLQDRLGSSDLQGIEVDYDAFMTIISDNLEVLVKAFSSSFIIPDFRDFCRNLDDIYNVCRSNNSGKVASYIPQLARSNPEHWGMSVCTVDGQRYSLGDVNVPFTLQSCSKPLTYAMALGMNGTDTMHKFIGMEPSGRYFNELCLDYSNKPHNPMINAGAIMTAALLKPELSAADRFDFVFNMYKRLAGDEFLGFNNAVFLSEKECADRNFALAYFMRENKCFPEGTRLHETLDFYFQLCSLEITAESGAVMAATLANGGLNPLTGDPVLTVDAVRNTLTLMHSCGMYNYSGQFAFKVGLPSKSGVSGCVLLVVPNTMGICLWSPPLDSNGNSCRAVQFCMELVSRFNFHNFDNLRGHFTNKVDPRTVKAESTAQILFDLLFSAAAGDLSALRRHSLSGTDMEAQDYDGRTALHVATSEGHVDIVEYLLRNCQVHPLPKDRWGRTPLDDANSFNQPLCAALIRESCKKRSLDVPSGPTESTTTTPTTVNCEE